jgi:hypothetical protein
MYIPEEAIDLAMNKGYTVTLSPERGVSLDRGSRKIWQIREGYQTADLLPRNDGTGQFYFTNHIKFDDVVSAMERPFT